MVDNNNDDDDDDDDDDECPARVGFGQSRSESEEKTPFTLVEKCKLKKSFQATNMVMITFSLVLRKRVGRPSRVR